MTHRMNLTLNLTHIQMQGSDVRSAWYDEADKRNFMREAHDRSTQTRGAG